MASLKAFLVAVALAATTANGAVWIKGSAGASCEAVCASRSGCDEEAWPNSEEEFREVAEQAGQECDSTQEGGANYDPSTDGRHCGWKGPDEQADGESRCGAAGDEGTYRFCPCNSDREL
eukprot:TRINITY_DN4305_c0_g1_i2.p2 TRINITY_DN4305_c0_g1~~TRINITY_DN4305_c0_g1_i2.p2  ORF type:complete len:120 (-),score=32.05 TRINITY_DN4305_c0_g1_i2:112-471(-)